MKPDNSIECQPHADLSTYSLELGLEAVKCFPIATLRLHSYNWAQAHRILGGWAEENRAFIGPSVTVVIDDTYKANEWSIEYNGKVFWSPGA